MKNRLFFFTLLGAALAGFPLHAAEVFPLAKFAGQYFKDARVQVSDGSGFVASGRVRPVFQIGAANGNARLKITGAVTFRGALRPFSSTVIFKRKSIDGSYAAALSNLAPGLDNGHSTELATYVAGPGSIRVTGRFESGTTTGSTTLFVRFKKRPRGTQILVTQTLSSSALTDSITWKFQGFSRH